MLGSARSFAVLLADTASHVRNGQRKTKALCVMPLLRISEVADELRVSPRIVQKWIHDGQLPARRYGARVVRVDRSDLDAFGRSAVDA